MPRGHHPFIPVPNGVQWTIHSIYTGYDCFNVLHFKHLTDVIDLAMLANLSETLRVWAVNYWGNGLNYQTHIAEWTLMDMQSETGPQYTISPFPVPAGSVVLNEFAPPAVAAVVRFRQGSRGRWNKGRMYAAGITSNACYGGVLSAGVISGQQHAYEQIRNVTATDGQNYKLAVCSLSYGGAWRTEGIVFPVETVDVMPKVGYQRRRQHTNP